MADPFSVALGVVTVVQLSDSVISFLRDVQRGFKSIDEDLEELIQNINSVRNLGEQVGHAFASDAADQVTVPKREQEAADNLWRQTSETLKGCEAILINLEEIVRKVAGDHDSSRLIKYLKKRYKDDELQELWRKLNGKRQTLAIQLNLLQIIITRKSRVDQSHSFDNLSSLMTDLVSQLKDQISSLQSTRSLNVQTQDEKDGVLETAFSIEKLASLNVHFDLPRSVASMFTGRDRQLATLSEALRESRKTTGTKTFVVYGLGGSGKTQFCCKFAQDNKQKFWGVFYIDASNAASIVSSYQHIAETARRQPNERNVKHWLSEQTKPWLLIVDNADERMESYPPESFIPESDYGLVLFTTRNHSLRTLGNFGPGSFEFQGLEEDPSTSLLLHSAGEAVPFRVQALRLANEICARLGFLPLAISQAGAAIRKGRCKLETCLSFLEDCWTRVRKMMESHPTSKPRRDSTVTYEAAYTTIEAVCEAAQEEHKELLKLFSFMHSQRFSYQLLLQAITNPQRQTLADKESKRHGPQPVPVKRSAGKRLRELMISLHRLVTSLGEKMAVPSVFNIDPSSADYELRKRLTELRDLALIYYIEADDSYSVHPLVHYWTQNSMTFGEKAVWCQAACNVLALGILLPPVGTTENDAELRRMAFPHVEYVRVQEEKLRSDLYTKQGERWRSWPSLQATLRRSDILQYAKFSLVYAECGQWDKAQELMLKVDGFLSQTVGLDHPVAIRARLFLSQTYWWLTDSEKAARLQQELLDTCQLSLGETHPDTLSVKDKLGKTMWALSNFKEARDLCQQATDGFQRLYPCGHVNTFEAMTHLGQCVGKLAEFDQAVILHSKALDGLTRDARATEYDSLLLDVKENLAMAKYDRYRFGKGRGDDLLSALKWQTDVFSQREDKLGKEHPLSLWAACNLARIKALDGQLVEAERMIRDRLPIVERTLGVTHMGTLFGMTFLGQVLTFAGKVAEAEDILLVVLEEHDKRESASGLGHQRMHADHLVAAGILLDCYRRQNKTAKAAELQAVVVRGTREIFGPGSAWEDYFVANYSVDTLAGATQDLKI